LQVFGRDDRTTDVTREASEVDVMWFRSKIDWWLGIILVLLPVVTLFSLLATVISDGFTAAIPGLFSVAMVAAIYGLLLIPIRYGVSQDELIVRFGVVRHRIPLGTIAEVRPTHNPLSSPALSLDRLAIVTTPGAATGAMISPDDRETFLITLAARAGLRRHADRLVRLSDVAPPFGPT